MTVTTAGPTRAATDPEVSTTTGRVRGFWRGSSAAFLGIPFAAAPIDEHRFAAPQPVTPWQGTRDARQFGPTPQRRPFSELTTIPEPSIPGSATLNVNVFTPEPDVRAALPVFVWIHGGGYFAGSPSSPWYDGASFNRDGVVTVSVSYRLGFDGFGWIDGAPLNRGLLDQIAALEWVRDNIAAFGGDPAAVTIGGQSAGGGSVLALMAAPRARGLFRGVIAQSGAVGSLTPADAEAAGRRLAEIVGVAPTMDAWRAVPEDTVLDHEREVNELSGPLTAEIPVDDLVGSVLHGASGALSLAFSPIVDGDVLPVDVPTAIAESRTADVSLLIGTTRNEFAYPSSAGVDEIAASLRSAGVESDAVSGYVDEVTRVGGEYAVSQLIAAGMFRRSAVALAAQRVAAGQGDATWLYDFALRAPVDGLSSHCIDLPFSWGLLDAEGVSESLGAPLPHILAQTMHSAWVRFIRDGAAPWLPASDAPAAAMRFDAVSRYDTHAYAFEAAMAGLSTDADGPRRDSSSDAVQSDPLRTDAKHG